MPVNPNADIEVTALSWVPPTARGQVRDIRVRWALEEIGLSYRTRLFDKRVQPDCDTAQPFAQVPVYREGDLTLFECGAIVLHIGEKDERLLPRDPGGRGRAIAWMFAALNSLDPMILGLIVARIFGEPKGWAEGVREAMVPLLEKRLWQVAAVLGDKPWLEDRFTVGDLMMIATLRTINRDHVTLPPALEAYVARGEARPAFQAALAGQMADFIPDEEEMTA